MLLDGDFSWVLDPTDATGGYNFSRALTELVQGLAMIDTWQSTHHRKVYTHISGSGAFRLDRIYATKELIVRKRGVEVVPAALTDQLAVSLRLSVELPILRMGRGMWIITSAILTENTCTEKLRNL